MSEGERRLAAIMFTDVVGFTSIGQRDEALALELLEEQRQIVRPFVMRHHGKEVKTIGDAFLVEFPSALEAVNCAVGIQEKMRDRNSGVPEGRRVQLRIGVHVGDVVHSQGDILGDAVNVSSRIEPLAGPGGVCISEQVYDHVRNKVDFPLERLEGKTLKNVNVPVEVYRIVMPWETKSQQGVELDSKRVAVLPLKNMSPDPNDEYFADGMTEELITALSSVTELTVIARTSVMQYKTAPKRINDIGRELSVGTVIEGSVRKAANKVRITVQMIDARNEGHLWAQNYDKLLDDVFTVQSEVAEKVAGALKVKLLESEKRRVERATSTDSETYNIYLRGMFYWNKRTPEATEKAADLFREAVARDPSFALGHAALGQAYFITAANYYDDPAVYYPKAKESSLNALSLDEGLAEAHATLGAIASGHDYDWDRAEAEFKRAIELNPSYPSAHQWYAQHLICLNRRDESWNEVQRALELSPLSLIINTNLADAYYWRHDYEKGIEQAKKVIEMDANFPNSYLAICYNCAKAGKFKEAEEALDSYARSGGRGDVDQWRAWLYSTMGRKEEAMRLQKEVLERPFDGQVSLYFMGGNYIKLGEVDKGFELLERAFEVHDRYLGYLGMDDEFDQVKGDPRYAALIQKLGLAGRIER